MSSRTQSNTRFLPLLRAAERFGVPAAWLRSEALAGRVPALQADGQILFLPDVLGAVLRERATETGSGTTRDEARGTD